MPYARPTLTQLRDQVLQDVNAAQIIDTSGNAIYGLLLRNVLTVVAYAVAGFSYLHYGYQDWIARQAIPATATDDWLNNWGALRGVNRLAPTAATGYYTTTGVNGTTLSSGNAIVRGDGFGYVTTAGGTVSGGALTVPIAASTPGSNGNAANAATLWLSNGVAGINSQGTAAGAIAGGADQETEAAYRSRVLQIWANPPQGGALTDYDEWALAVPGVTRAWAQGNLAASGTVTVFFMMDVTEAAHGGFPQGSNGVAAGETRDTAATGDQLTVANALFTKQPVTALVYANAPTNQPQNFTIANFSPNTGAMQAAVNLALTDLFLRAASPGGTIYANEWEAAIGAVSGLNTFTVSSPSGPITASAGALFTLGTTTFTS